MIDPTVTNDLAALNNLSPKASWDLESGTITLELAEFSPVVRALRVLGTPADELWLEIDGEKNLKLSPEILLSLESDILENDAPMASFPGGRVYRQTDVRVVLMNSGEELYVSSPHLFEDQDFPRIDPGSLARTPVPGARFPHWLQAQMGWAGHGEPDDLIRAAALAQHGILQVSVNPDSGNLALIQAFRDHGAKLKIEAVFTSADGEPTGWKITDTTNGKQIPAELGDLWHYANAAFNSNVFRWDGDAANAALRFSNPGFARNWPRYIVDSQRRQGSGLITRENRSSNQRPFQREFSVKLGTEGVHVTPNGEIFNPPLTGLAIRDLYRWDPTVFTRQTLQEMIHSLAWEREWLAKTHGVSGKGHALLGFTWTNLGSGRDNAPRSLGKPGCLGVDLICYYKMMIDQESELEAILGDFRRARALAAQARELRRVIDQEYWHEGFSFYMDIIQDQSGRVEHSEIRTMVGFWPLLARVPGPGRLRRLLGENLMNPNRFGAGPYPTSVAVDHEGEHDGDGPLFDWEGRYWRGGGWPIDWTLLKKGLRWNGERAEAARQQLRVLGALTEAHAAYRQGDSPRARIPSSKKDRAVFWEALGRVPDTDGRRRVTFNRKLKADGETLHDTRENLGWSLSTPLETLEDVLGMEGVPRFLGEAKDLGIWVHQLLVNPYLCYQHARYNPALRPLLDYLNDHLHATAEDFAAYFDRQVARSPELAHQARMIHQGYLEISPTFDPGRGGEQDLTRVEKIPFQGQRVTLGVERISLVSDLNENQIRITAESEKPFHIQFNRCWILTGASCVSTDSPQASSRIVEVGGMDRRETILDLVPPSG